MDISADNKREAHTQTAGSYQAEKANNSTHWAQRKDPLCGLLPPISPVFSDFVVSYLTESILFI